jgi:hypothetical protein
MEDIHPCYQPRGPNSSNQPSENATPAARPVKKVAGPMDRFLSAAKPKVAVRKALSPKKSTSNLPAGTDSRTESKKPMVMTGAGTKGSGARTLSGETERLQAQKQKQQEDAQAKKTLASSRYFQPKSAVQEAAPVREVVDLCGEDEEEGERSSEQSAGTLIVQIDGEEVFELEIGLDGEVEQEEGYRSLSPTLSDIQVSSPVGSPTREGESDEEVPSPETVRAGSKREMSEVWAGVEEVLSSPIAARKRQSITEMSIKKRASGETREGVVTTKTTVREVICLVSTTPSPVKPTESQVETQEEETQLQGDLSSFFASFESGTSGGASSGGGAGPNSRLSSFESSKSKSSEVIVSSPVSECPPGSDFEAVAESDHEGKEGQSREVGEEGEEEEETTLLFKQKSRLDTIAAGWRNRFTLGSHQQREVSRACLMKYIAY